MKTTLLTELQIEKLYLYLGMLSNIFRDSMAGNSQAIAAYTSFNDSKTPLNSPKHLEIISFFHLAKTES